MKKWLGIEGVKLDIALEADTVRPDGPVRGTLLFQSMSHQTVTGVQVAIVERYERGRGDSKRIDEYELGRVILPVRFDVPPNEVVELPFELPFDLLQSDMDKFTGRNVIFKGLGRAAKMLHAVKSSYRVEAEATVQGVALNPFDKQPVKVK